jgi:hypothetical protein
VSPSFGYIIGFVLAAAVVGRLAGAGADRTPLRTAGLMVFGNVVIYLVGVPWLAVALGVSFGPAVALGLTPFLLGDALKIAIAAGVLPASWRLLDRADGGRYTSRLKSRLNSYTRRLADAEDPITYAGRTVPLDGTNRVLRVAIPRGATLDQLEVFSQATREAQRQGVTMQFVTLG